MKNKIFSIMLVCSLAFTLLPCSAFATSSSETKHPQATKTVTKNVFINSKNFDDPNFREYIKGFDEDKNGKLSIYERNAVKYMNLNGAAIKNLHGIGWFKELEVLNIADCRNIKSYTATNNPNLRKLICWEAINLGTLKFDKNINLEVLDCSYTGIRNLHVGQNVNLKELNCSGCHLKSLDVSKNSKLTKLDCGDNQIESLIINKNSKITELNCWNNPKLKHLALDRTKNLVSLDCSECINLESLALTNCPKLKRLKCWSDYKLKSLNLSKNSALEYLDCSYNELEELDVTNNLELKWLYCQSCNMSGINLNKNTKLEEYVGKGNIKRVDMPVVMEKDFPASFDFSKVYNIAGGTCDKKRKLFVFDEGSSKITYRYHVTDKMYTLYTIETSYKTPIATPTRLDISTDYGIIKASWSESSQKGATYRIAYRSKDSTKWNYINTKEKGTVITGLQQNQLYYVGLANVVDGRASTFYEKKVYTNRDGTKAEAMPQSVLEDVQIKQGKATVTAKTVRFNTAPKNVTYRFLYRIKGTKKWTIVDSTKNTIHIEGLAHGKTYTFSMIYYYKSPVATGHLVKSKYAKYINLQAK